MIKDYELLNKLGQGNFGSIFRVRKKSTSETGDRSIYVMKIINVSRIDKHGREEAQNEVKILSSLNSHYIVKYYDSFVENKNLHIILEFCDRGDLAELIKKQNRNLMAEKKIWRIFIQIALGLEYLHNKKILHRDIKSMNIFLARNSSIRIGDLGVAKVLNHESCFAYTKVGTPYYLSPELCEEKPYNEKSDVWALGCVLYEMCCLKHPFQASNQAALIFRIVNATYDPIPSIYSDEITSLVEQTLSKNYNERPTIEGILCLPGMRERAVSLGIEIPESSILFYNLVLLPQKISLIEPEETKKPTKEIPMMTVKLNKPLMKINKPPIKQVQVNLNSEHKQWTVCELRKPRIPVRRAHSSRINKPEEDYSTPTRMKINIKNPVRLESIHIPAAKPVVNLLYISKVKMIRSDPLKNEQDETKKEFINIKLREIEKRKQKLKGLIKCKDLEIEKEIEEDLFVELYNFFKLKMAHVLNEEDQREIYEFTNAKLPVEKTNVLFAIYKLLHLEDEVATAKEMILSLKKELRNCNN